MTHVISHSMKSSSDTCPNSHPAAEMTIFLCVLSDLFRRIGASIPPTSKPRSQNEEAKTHAQKPTVKIKSLSI
jgi:hypothetical protein